MNTKKMVVLAVFVSLAVIMHIVESWIPVPLPIPGLKLGLANIISLFILVKFNLGEALSVAFVRIVLGSLLSGMIFGPAFILSLSGAAASTLIMYLFLTRFTPPFSIVGVSVIGAVTHNIAQIISAVFIVADNSLLWYLPYLMLFAVPTGVSIGLAVRTIKYF